MTPRNTGYEGFKDLKRPLKFYYLETEGDRNLVFQKQKMGSPLPRGEVLVNSTL